MSGLTVEHIKEMVRVMKSRAVPPAVVSSESDAARLSEITGEKWNVGDEFYKKQPIYDDDTDLYVSGDQR